MIAIEIGIAEKTLEIHRSHVMHKMGARTLAELISITNLLRQGKGNPLHYGAQRLEAACTRAHRLGAYGYRTVKNTLSTGLDRLPAEDETAKSLPPMPHHDNIRGAAYYTLEETPC